MRAPAVGPALTRLARASLAALICAVVLVPAVGPGRARASNDVTWWIHSELTDRQTSDTVNGVTTTTETIADTSHQTSSDGQSLDDVQTLQRNADGSSSEHEAVSATKSDGSNGSLTRDATTDSNGNRSDQSTSDWTDADGNRTTWTDWNQYDSQGHRIGHGEDVRHDKVPPPTPKLPKSAAPTSSAPATTTAAPSQSATAGPSSSPTATTEPDYWTGTITYRFAGSATGYRPDDGGHSYPGTYNDTATYTVVLGRDSSTSSGASWSLVRGEATASINDDLLEINQGTTQRTTWFGQAWVATEGLGRLSLSIDQRSYSIECRGAVFSEMQWVQYEPNEPGRIYDGPNRGTWWTPEFSLKNLSMPSDPGVLSGSRKIPVVVRTASGPDVPVQADVSWNLTAGSGTAPTAPPDVTGSVNVNDPPYPVSIPHPGQRAVVGLPILSGQQVTLRITANSIGPVKVSLLKPNGTPVFVESSSSASFELPAQTLGTDGTYSIVVEPRPGSTGGLTLEVTSP